MLENILEKLIEDSNVLSWNIYGKENYTQLSIRFEADDSIDKEYVKYKRVRPSQLTRDFNRGQLNRSRHSSMKTVDKSPHTLEHLHTDNGCQYKDVQIIQGGQYEPVSTPVSKLNPDALDFEFSSNNPTVLGGNITDFNEDSSEQVKVSLQHVNTEQGTSNASKIVAIDEHILSEKTDINGKRKCVECGNDVRRSTGFRTSDLWWKCTVCDDQEMCLSCYDRKTNIHSDHISKLYMVNPKYQYDEYCKTCGDQYNGDTVVTCSQCKDFTMCTLCYDDDLHDDH